METVQAPVLKGALMIAMLHVLLLVLMIANILALLLVPTTAPVVVDLAQVIAQ